MAGPEQKPALVVEVEGLSKSYGDVDAVVDLSFSVQMTGNLAHSARPSTLRSRSCAPLCATSERWR